MHGRPVKFRGPPGDVAVIDYLDLASLRMMRPHERTTFTGLTPSTELGGVVRDRRPEI
jgi:hypothetical protein